MNASGNEVLIIIILALVIFGGAKLPQIARNLGSAQKEFKKGLAESEEDSKKKKAQKTPDDSTIDEA